MESIKFGIDVDGVLRDLTASILDMYNSRFNKHMTMDEFVHYDVKDQFPDIPDAGKYFFSGDNARQLLCNSTPIPGALNAFNVLSELGEVYIVTSQHGFENITYTLNWLHNNGFNTDQICFVSDKSVVSAGLDYLIDDNPLKFVGCKCNAVLIDMPYNRHNMNHIKSKFYGKTFYRYDSLEKYVNTLIN